MIVRRSKFSVFQAPTFGVVVAAAMLSLTACNTSDPTMGVASQDSGGSAPTSNAAANSAVKLSTQADVAKASAKIYVAPIVGSTVAAITPLSRRIAAVAPANGIALVGSADPAQNFIIKGYFSAFPEGGATTLVFVWDVFDTKGVRLHRIQGQESVPGTSAADPWSIVPPATMERVADRFIADFNAWRGTAGAASPAVPAEAAAAPAQSTPNATPNANPNATSNPPAAPTPAPAPSNG
jgi:hypothetical protein